MSPTEDVMVLWSLAATEARMTGWGRIEPAHLLCAALKLCEADSPELEKLGAAVGDPQGMLGAHKRLVEALHMWQIEIPRQSTRLRRALRRPGRGSPESSGQVLHRSQESRHIFQQAQRAAQSQGREEFDVADLTMCVLSLEEGWIPRTMSSLGLPSAREVGKPFAEIPEQWQDILIPVQPPGPLGDSERRRIESDAAVRVLLNSLESREQRAERRPRLLVSGGRRRAVDVLRDLVWINHHRRGMPLHVLTVDSRALLGVDEESDAANPVQVFSALGESEGPCGLLFVPSMHRYLSESLAGEQVVRQFRRWVRRTDGRWIFGMPESRYRQLLEGRADWEGTFRVTWIHDSPAEAVGDIEL